MVLHFHVLETLISPARLAKTSPLQLQVVRSSLLSDTICISPVIKTRNTFTIDPHAGWIFYTKWLTLLSYNKETFWGWTFLSRSSCHAGTETCQSLFCRQSGGGAEKFDGARCPASQLHPDGDEHHRPALPHAPPSSSCGARQHAWCHHCPSPERYEHDPPLHQKKVL